MYNLVSRSRSLIEGKGVGRHAATKTPVTQVPGEPLRGGPGTVSDKVLRTPSYNRIVTPVDASKNVLQYASRPLPATPTSRAKMADRPSTSGGPTSGRTAKNDFKTEKRASRDDFYVGARAYGGNRSGILTPFRVQPPTPDTSPRTIPIQQFTSDAKRRELTTNLMTEVRNGDIGMALGSPGHPPNFSDTWDMQNAAQPTRGSPPHASPPASRSSSVDTFDMPVSRKPSGKWRLFSIFMRKPSDQSVQAISISDPNGLHGTNRPEEGISAVNQAPPSDPKSPVRSNTTTSRKVPKHKPIVVRSQTMPLDGKVDTYDRKPRGGEKRGDAVPGHIPITLNTSLRPSPATGPLLNVEIPDIRMERYSVMFNSVLNSNPSLLSRRQATAQKLRSIEDAVERDEEEKPHGTARRATSPQPATRSSGLALFPTSRQTPNLAPPRLSPRLRSNTSPAFLPSPSKATFDHTTPGYQSQPAEETFDQRKPSHPLPKHYETPGIAVTTDSAATEQEPLPIPPPQFSNDQSSLILDSPTEIDSEGHEAIAWQVWKPITYQAPPEPKWQMISPSQKTPSTASSYTGSYRKRSPSLASSARTHITRPSDDFDDRSTPDSIGNSDGNSKMTAVEISIARQISISRQQRKLLQPLRTGSSPSTSPRRKPPHASPARTSPMAGKTVGESGRIAETKTSTPTLVHPTGFLDPQLTLAQHRKSERVVLEDA
ncbi:hypothetical protein SAMD00023353_4900390 [Rosellinia necatrix]|uniref:Uncharacterized protein n=1 Tax=Rosellinia necatrix TaxID=77044 RepID=A0A1W2TPQ2_ROSNE|nr:hypothetical protein SAMD00023353_4900390 [Rosellinia necatrix]